MASYAKEISLESFKFMENIDQIHQFEVILKLTPITIG